MTGILAEIVAYKREFVASSKQGIPQMDMELRAAEAGPVRGFADAIAGKGCALIAEVKTASPSKGIIRDDADPYEVADIYEKNGAACLSVLTDEQYFKGSLERLEKIRRQVSLPVLRKDFIIDPYQIYEARAAGADAVLLIAACLSNEQLLDFIEITALLGMDALVEVHTENEMARLEGVNTRLVGINNRNLETFNTDIATTGRLAQFAPDGALLVGESGIFTAGDIRDIHAMGADAVLVGEALMREKNIGEKVKELANAVTYV